MEGRAGLDRLPCWPKGGGAGGGCAPSHATRRKLKHNNVPQKLPKQLFKRPLDRSTQENICRCTILAMLGSSWFTPT